MSNKQIHSFEKNRYYFGKPLTVRDFQAEQNYFNEKRHLLNRLIHGSGIVYGLDVAGEQDGMNRGIVIKPGVALDGCGKEIVVSRDIAKTDIRELPGFPLEMAGEATLYLTLHYLECSKERIPVTSNPSACGGACEPNRILESCEVRLAAAPPEPDADFAALLRDTRTVYSDESIWIERSVPVWVRPGEAFEITLTLNTRHPMEYIQYQVTEDIPDSLQPIDRPFAFFELSNAEEGQAFSKTYWVRAGEQPGFPVIQGRVSIYGDLLRPTESSVIAVLSPSDYNRAVAGRYFEYIAERDESSSGNDGVVLAALHVTGEGYIADIDRAPRRYVYTNPLLGLLFAGITDAEGKLPRHSLTHRHDGDDPLDVTDLPGLLKEEQKIAVFTKGDEYVHARRLSFSGEGVEVQQGSFGSDSVNVHIFGQSPIVSGQIEYKNVLPGRIHMSDPIQLPKLSDPLISAALDAYDSIRYDPAEVSLNCAYDKMKGLLTVSLADQRSKGESVTYTVRWWAFSKTQEMGKTGSHEIQFT
jgi:hypothetical protein